MQEWRRIIFGLALLSIPPTCAADNCSQCVLGIWDDPALSTNLGEIVAGQPKDIYVGIKFAEGFNGTIAISVSIDGLGPFLVTGVEPVAPTVTICDGIGTPADTTQGGGCFFSWPSCLVGDQALLRVSLLTSSNVTNALLRVKRQYPSIEPGASAPVFYQCNDPQFTPTPVTGGYYILNWDGDPRVFVDGAAWSEVKRLYK